MHDSNEQSIVGTFRESNTFLGTTASVVLFFFLWLNIEPVAAVVKDVANDPMAIVSPHANRYSPDGAAIAVVEQDFFGQLHKTLLALQKAVKPNHDLIVKKERKDKNGRTVLDITIVGTPAEMEVMAQQKKLRELAQELQKADDEAMQSLLKEREQLRQFKVAAEILNRHDRIIEELKSRNSELQDKLAKLARSVFARDLYNRVADLVQVIGRWNVTGPKVFDPNNMPFRTNESKARQPITEKSKFLKVLSRVNVAATAQNSQVRFPDGKKSVEVSEREFSSILSDDHPYWLDRGEVEVASLAGISAIPPPGTEYLTPNDEVQITPAIQAKAAELHGNPVEIYNWVHNKVSWIPSYGSVQGSQITLEKLQGNAFDISSLLVALLRASGIPARYVYGTVDIPADTVQNWIGEAVSLDAAQNIIGQGGIPNIALVKGGRTVAFRMEHVWVEAWVDYFPSRGAKNIDGDSWVPMDGAFKQYKYIGALRLADEVPLDRQNLETVVQSSSESNAAEGWSRLNNLAAVESELTAYRNQLESHLNNNHPGITYKDAFGEKSIVQVTEESLSASLPYSVKARLDAFPSIPSALHHLFNFSLFAGQNATSAESPLLTFQATTFSLGGAEVALVFVPASDNDAQAIRSYLATRQIGQTLKMPASISMIAELRVDGVTKVRSPEIPLGTELRSLGGFTTLDLQGWDLNSGFIVAGQQTAIGLSLHGISVSQLQRLQGRLEELRDFLDQNPTELSDSANPTGNLLTATIWNYFASIEAFGQKASALSSMVDIPGLSFGLASVQATPRKMFGLTMAASFTGYLLDVGHIRHIGASAINNIDDKVTYYRLIGEHASYSEGLALESLGATEGVQAVSSMRLLMIANSQGQKTYQLNKTNVDQLDRLGHSPAVKSNIKAAVEQGKIVTIHESPVSYAGFFGSGYIIFDPATGSGAYLIEGGYNGASGESKDGAPALVNGWTIKDFILNAINCLKLSTIDVVIQLGGSISDLSKACFGAEYISGISLAITLAICGLIFGSVLGLPLIFGTIMGIILNYAIANVLRHVIALCLSS